MTRFRVLARNSAINLAGQASPLLAAVVALPTLIAGLGDARFAVLTIAWATIGYFSLFDLGLGRALTQAVASRSSMGERELGTVVRTALGLMLGLGLLGGATLLAGTPLIVEQILNVPPELRHESFVAFVLMAVSVPAMVVTSGFRGILEARQDFAVVTALRVPLSLLTYLGPVAVLPLSHSLSAVVGVIAATRVLGLLLHVAVGLTSFPFLRAGGRLDLAAVRPLLHVGGWITVSNVVSPLMVSLDRYLIGALLPIAAVAYYATPYELITKVWIISAALTGVLIPAF